MISSSWWKYQKQNPFKVLENLETGAVLEAAAPLSEFMDGNTEELDATGVEDRSNAREVDQLLASNWKEQLNKWILARGQRQQSIKDMMSPRSNESLNTEEENEGDKRAGGHEM